LRFHSRRRRFHPLKAKTFEDRYVAFVDILGFSNLVNRMRKEPALFKLIRGTLDSIDEQAQQFEEYRRQKRTGARSVLPPVQLEMTAFSDCYVVSDTTSAWRVVAAVQFLGSTLLARGIASRGGIVQGQTYHRGRVLFGPAVVKAYELERDVAKYPRIIVSETVRRAVWRYHTGLWKGQLLRRDIDGCWFVNVLMPSRSNWKQLPQVDSRQSTVRFLKDLRPQLQEQLARETDEGRLSKWRWLAHWYNRDADGAGIQTIELPDEFLA
jgi:hypothetical protein